MKKLFYSLIFSAITLVSFLNGKNVFAEGYTGPKLTSPTPAIGTLFDFITKVLEIVIRISVPVITLAFIWTGYLFVSTNGVQAKQTTARGWLLGTVIATAIIFGSVLIANIIQGTVSLLGG